MECNATAFPFYSTLVRKQPRDEYWTYPSSANSFGQDIETTNYTAESFLFAELKSQWTHGSDNESEHSSTLHSIGIGYPHGQGVQNGSGLRYSINGNGEVTDQGGHVALGPKTSRRSWKRNASEMSGTQEEDLTRFGVRKLSNLKEMFGRRYLGSEVESLCLKMNRLRAGVRGISELVS